MPPVIKVGDQTALVPTSLYPFAKFQFETFNPVQSRVFEFYDQETSVVSCRPHILWQNRGGRNVSCS